MEGNYSLENIVNHGNRDLKGYVRFSNRFSKTKVINNLKNKNVSLLLNSILYPTLYFHKITISPDEVFFHYAV